MHIILYDAVPGARQHKWQNGFPHPRPKACPPPPHYDHTGGPFMDDDVEFRGAPNEVVLGFKAPGQPYTATRWEGLGFGGSSTGPGLNVRRAYQ